MSGMDKVEAAVREYDFLACCPQDFEKGAKLRKQFDLLVHGADYNTNHTQLQDRPGKPGMAPRCSAGSFSKASGLCGQGKCFAVAVGRVDLLEGGGNRAKGLQDVRIEVVRQGASIALGYDPAGRGVIE